MTRGRVLFGGELVAGAGQGVYRSAFEGETKLAWLSRYLRLLTSSRTSVDLNQPKLDGRTFD
jgi:hypothetical protein